MRARANARVSGEGAPTGQLHRAGNHMEGGGDDVPRGSTYIDRSNAVKSASLGAASLEHPRPWLQRQWLGLAAGVPSCSEPSGAPWGGAGTELRHCSEGHTLDHAAAPLRGPSDEALKGTLM